MFELTINKNKPLVLIDYSYYVFYRYFATFRWFGYKKIELDVDTITENEDFMKAFKHHFNNDLKKICRKWKTEITNIILCMDCPRKKIWRNEIYPVYKTTRVQNEKFNNNIFKVFNEYINNKTQIKQVFCEKLEGDDVVYLVQKKFREKYIEFNINQNIVIITNDNDYLQLVDDTVSIFNMQMKNIAELRGNGDSNNNLLIKVLSGDKSDNIPKIASYMTKEKASSIANMDDIERNKYLEDNNLLENYKLNMTLISFEKIPNELVDKFYESIIVQLF